MNVRSTDTSPALAIAKAELKSSTPKGTATPSGAAASSVASPAGDTVELSASGRAEAGQAAAGSGEVETARLALRSQSDLGPARLHELREKARTGYYDQPEVLDRVAASAARDLAGPDAIGTAG